MNKNVNFFGRHCRVKRTNYSVRNDLIILNKLNNTDNLAELVDKIYEIIENYFFEMKFSIIPETRYLEKSELENYYMD